MNNNTNILRKYFSPANLRLAWERMIRSNGRDIKDFFGIEIYSSNLKINLERLSDLIISGSYKPKRPFKYYEPKASKTHRTKSVLYIDDALVYQAIADKVATDNYKRLSENNDFVFGSVLHHEVDSGLNLLNNDDADYYFFAYYVPLYNKFLNSINHEIENPAIKFKLETDITGFFDGIPHSKLLITLGKLGVEPEILDLLGNCLNIYSGTKESITPGVGIPQGPAASYFFANLFLSDLDSVISQHGYIYYRYMDDIRIYEETEKKLGDVLVVIDNFLKGRALSLNTKKTSIEEISKDRESEKATLLNMTYGNPDGYGTGDLFTAKNPNITVVEETSVTDQEGKFIIKLITNDELIDFCVDEINEVTEYLLNAFRKLNLENFNPREIANDQDIKRIIHYAYRWRYSNTILKNYSQPILNYKLVDIWLFCVEHFFWKANHFCWNLNIYGDDDYIRNRLTGVMKKFDSYEWVRYQILSNMSTVQSFNASDLRDMFRATKNEKSALVRIGYFMILIKHLNPGNQLFSALRQAIKEDNEPYIKNYLAGFLSWKPVKNNIDEIKFWFGL